MIGNLKWGKTNTDFFAALALASFHLFVDLFVTQGGLLLDPKKLRFENSPNKKTLKQAWRFFLLYYLFVTQAYESSNFLRSIFQLFLNNPKHT